jgi:hypothetical protein
MKRDRNGRTVELNNLVKISTWKRLALLVGLGLAACSPAPATPPAAGEATARQQPASAEATAVPTSRAPVASPLPAGTGADVPTGLPAPAVTEAAVPAEAAACPAHGTELVATDPGTVQLASGKVQLVEFFAFW